MRAVILLSGGMDSAVLLARQVEGHGADSALCLSVNYGAKHGRRELDCAARLAKHYGAEREVIELAWIPRLFRSALLRGGADIPVGHYADPRQAATVVPGRNGILAAIAAGFAECHGAVNVLMGAHLGDAAIYPDCRAAWVDRMNAAIWAQTERRVSLRAPFIEVGWHKREVVAEGNRLGVPWHITWSCYNGGEEPCGKCGACVERDEAFVGALEAAA